MSRPPDADVPGPGDQAAHLRSVPFPHAAGTHWVATCGREVRLRLPFSRVVRAPGGAGVDPRAIMAILDHACGAAMYAALEVPLPTATLELRVAFQRPVPDGTDIMISARATHIAGMTAFVEASASIEAGGLPLVSANGAFIVGAHPGGASGQDLADPWQAPRAIDIGDLSQLDSFDEFLGLARTGTGVSMVFADRLIGAVSLPALHGGSVASLLATAAGDLARSATDARLVAITIQYLRAGRAENVEAEAEWEKRGARSSVVAVVARQAPGSREVARAQCTFVAGA